MAEKEYKEDMKHNLAEMYAKNMVDYGVDVTKAWQTATQQSCALEKAYIRGRQYEADRFIELRKEYNDGSERLTKDEARLFKHNEAQTLNENRRGGYNHGYADGYREAIDDVVNLFKSKTTMENNLIEGTAECLKAGDNS